MSMTVDELETAALQLQICDRGELIRRLIRSLDAGEPELSEEEWIASWGPEAARRSEDLDFGRVSPLDGPTVLKRWEERYQ